jgi:DNA replication and repair protein RecF
MIIDIHLQNFRSYNDESFEFTPSVNIIVGPNASGKTNLLEAILLVSKGSSYRAKDIELVQFDKPWARVEVHTGSGDSRIAQVKPESERADKQFRINDQPFKRLSLPKTLPVVLFEPNHLQLLTSGPELRRQFMDDLLEQTQLGFASVRRQYKRALAQRNALLKHGRAKAETQLFAWNVRLSELGSQVVMARLQLIADMSAQIDTLYKKLSGSKESIKLGYSSNVSAENYASDLIKKLEAHEAADFERGFTAYGPHRDDLQIFIDEHPAQGSASRGETRTLLLVLKVLEAQLLEQARGAKPLLLLDDVFSELDGARRQALTRFLRGYQTFITTTDADVVIQHFTETTNIIPLDKSDKNS